jgi:hypothetical protein
MSAPWHCVAHSRTANAPHPRTLPESTGSNHDVRPAGAPSQPLLVLCGRPLLQHHAGHCYNNSGAVEHAGTGRCHACHCTPYGSLSTASSSPFEDAPDNHYAFTLEAALFKYGTRHDDKTGARTARTTANSAALHAIPPHVAKQCGMIVIHPLLGL